MFVYRGGAASQSQDSVAFGFLPAFSYSPEFGFIFGGLFDRKHLSNEVKPYINFTYVNALISTNGLYFIEIVRDQPDIFNTGIRTNFNINLQHIFEDYYFGIGNHTQFDSGSLENGDYFVRTFSSRLNLTARRLLTDKQADIPFELLIILGYDYLLPYSKGDQTIFKNDPEVIGRMGGTAFYSGLGFVIEARDNEILPTSGYYLSTQIDVASSLISDFPYTRTILEFRNYQTISLGLDLTFATRLEWRYIYDDVPFWLQSQAGFDGFLRGYNSRRFLDKGAISTNFELRSWLMRFDLMNSRIGAHLFTDAARVYDGFLFNGKRDHDFWDFHQTYGFGGTLSLYNPNFFIRAELGFSREITLFYAGVGYLF